MATTPIDELVVILGLNAQPLVKGLRDTTAAFRKSKEDITQGAKGVEAATKSAGFGVAALRVGVAGLGAALGAVAVRDITEWIRRMTEAGSATERFAARNNTTVGTVTALRGAVRQAGGTFAEADASLAGVVQQIARLNLYGDVAKFPQLRALGVNIADFDTNKSDDVLRFLRELTKMADARPNRAETATLLSDIGLAPGAIDLVMGGTAAFDRRIALAKQFAATMDQAAKDARSLDEVFGRILVVTDAIRAKVYSWFASSSPVTGGASNLESFYQWIADKIGASGGAPAKTGGATMPIVAPTGGGLTRVTTAGGKSVTVAASAAPAFKGFLDTLEGQGAPLGDLGGYANRNIARTNIPSEHSKGLAVDMGSMKGRDDIDPALRGWINAHPAQWRAALSKYGMKSGGDFKDPDLGHVEYNTTVQVMTQPGADAKAIGAETAAQTKRALMAAGANGGSQ